MKMVAVVMAGGRGERFWPRSRRSLPKQFLSLTDDGITMIQHTINRIKKIVSIEDIFVVTNVEYRELVEKQLNELPKENILIEPSAKNTAPCIGLAAVHIHKKYMDATMLILPSDHLIKYEELFIDTLKEAIEVANLGGNLVTIGITPAYAETGYGYIKFEKHENESISSRVYKVSHFAEKPNLEIAKEYLNSGKYLWNSGIFIWKSSSILEQFNKWLPDMYKGLMNIKEVVGSGNYEKILQEEFERFQKESIDYGIIEKADGVYTVPGNFGWDDVGSWNSLERINKTNDLGNIVEGNVISVHTKNCIIQGTNKLIATVGLENLIIVDTEDAILICKKSNSQNIKDVIENLKICNRVEYL